MNSSMFNIYPEFQDRDQNFNFQGNALENRDNNERQDLHHLFLVKMIVSCEKTNAAWWKEKVEIHRII